MTVETILTKELLHNLFNYCDGILYWKNPTNKRIVKGSKAGSYDKDGYLIVQFFGKKYKIHRLIFMMHYGYMPIQIDHINCNKSDNHIFNLRKANNTTNQQNRKIQKNNKSGVKGVCWNKNMNQWMVRLRVNDETKYFGSYHDIQVAKFVCETMRYKFHGKFANHG